MVILVEYVKLPLKSRKAICVQEQVAEWIGMSASLQSFIRRCDMNLKYSRQRESIKKFLAERKDHPTADVVYFNIREQFPNISLGTVYRNLSLLADIGEIIKINVGDGADRFDGNVNPHYHFICKKCNQVLDLDMEDIKGIDEIASESFAGKIDGHYAYFYGVCENCLSAEM